MIMKKLLTRIVILCSSVMLFAGCIPQEPVDRNYMVNFEAIWTVINERYCFLEDKGVDWDSVYTEYKPLVSKVSNDQEFFNLMEKMLDTLKDGHVNLVSPFDITFSDDWMGDETKGLNIYARRKILGKNLNISGGMYYNLYSLSSRPDVKFGYIMYPSFSSSIGNTDYMFELFKNSDAIILDVRDNGGGLVDNSDKLVSLFLKEKTLVGYTSHKLGPGRDNFSKPKEIYVEPSENKRWTDKPVIILQDRGCYSATNDFLFKVSVAPHIVRIGLPSGGGGGMPVSAELPNGWRLRYSAVKSFDRNMKSVEQGVQPDIYQEGVSFDESPAGPDIILTRAIQYIIDLKPAQK